MARMSGEGHGYKKLIVWQNAKKLRKLIYDITGRFPRAEMRRVSQMRDAARSGKQNIQEGYYRPGTKEYIRYLIISRGSINELSGDIDDCLEDKLITKEEFQELDKLCGTTDYLLKRLIASIRKKEKEGTWK